MLANRQGAHKKLSGIGQPNGSRPERRRFLAVALVVACIQKCGSHQQGGMKRVNELLPFAYPKVGNCTHFNQTCPILRGSYGLSMCDYARYSHFRASAFKR